MKLNLPNKLTLGRVIAIPVLLVFLVHPAVGNPYLWRLLTAGLFILIAATDFFDGMIARKQGLVTDFGKFLDPLADKMLIFGTYIALSVRLALDGERLFAYLLFWSTFVIVFREMAITSMRLLVSNTAGKVIAASWPAKWKTLAQMVAAVVVMVEPLIAMNSASYRKFLFFGGWPLSYLALAVALFLTVYSGILYIISYWKYLDPNK